MIVSQKKLKIELYAPAILTYGYAAAAAAAKSLQLCLTLCSLIDGSPPGSAVPGILRARTLENTGCHFLLQRTKNLKVGTSTDICIPMFKAALLTIPKRKKLPSVH